MPYTLTTFDGGTSFVIADSAIDTTQTPLNTVGRGATGFAAAIGEDFLHLLENYADSSNTSLNALVPVRGQLWFNTATGKMMVNTAANGSPPVWVLVSSTTAATSAPSTPAIGDGWFNTTTSVFNIWNGSAFVTIGPATAPVQSATPFSFWGNNTSVTAAPGSLTIAQAQTMLGLSIPSNSILGNNTGLTSSPLSLSVAQTQTLLGLQLSPNTLFGNNTGITTVGTGLTVPQAQSLLGLWIAPNTVLGNSSSNPAGASPLSVTQTQTLLGLNLPQYQIVLGNTSGNMTTVGGTGVAGQVLTSVGFAAPVWASPNLSIETITAASFASTIQPLGIVSVLPSASGYTGPSVIFNTADGQVYRYFAGVWSVNVPAGNITGQLTSGQIGTLSAANFASAIQPLGIVSTLPSPAAYTGVSVLFNTTDFQVYRYDTTSSSWTLAVPAINITGQLTSTQILSLATTQLSGQISTAQITNNAITASLIASGTVTNAQIALATVTGANIATATITGTNIASGTITGANLVTGTLPGTALQPATITSTQLASQTIIGGNIANSTITTGNIASGTITTSNIASGTITAANLHAGTITSTQIASATILGANIANGTILASNLAPATITDASGVLAPASVNSDSIAPNAVTIVQVVDVISTALLANTLTKIATLIVVADGNPDNLDFSCTIQFPSSVPFTAAGQFDDVQVLLYINGSMATQLGEVLVRSVSDGAGGWLLPTIFYPMNFCYQNVPGSTGTTTYDVYLARNSQPSGIWTGLSDSANNVIFRSIKTKR